MRTAEILDAQVTTADLADGAVTSTKIASDAVGATHIGDGEITAAQIVNYTLTKLKMADESVDSRVIKDWSITSDDFASGAVDSWAIENGSIKYVDVDTGEIQRRVSGICSSGSSIRSIGSTGTVTCENDDSGIGSIVAGAGLTGGGSGAAVDLAVAVPLSLEASFSQGESTVIRGNATAEGIGVAGESAQGVGVKGSGSISGGSFTTSSATGVGISAFAAAGSGGLAARFNGNVLIRDRDTWEDLIELGNGLDYAEGFNVTQDDLLEPGSVLVIDPNHPGHLRISHQAYDSRVVGIIAGANGLGSGIRLGAVALAGRVYCNVEATNGAIQPGDLLTTSDTPGFAMKAMDPSKARGAILGKAMEPLDVGTTGQILVLVTLQ